MAKKEDDEQDWSSKFFAKILGSIFILPIIMWLWPTAVPFRFFEFWAIRGTVSEWLYTAWPIFAWGVGVNVIYSLFTRNDRETNRHAERIIIGGTIISFLAGTIEEMTFRWLFFLDNIVSVKITNFLFFGFFGFGIPQWFHLHVFGPLANWTTFGGLEKYIFHPSGWAIGASMLATNAFFRDGHKYQGLFGVINSWFGGMFLFWIMFRYGLPAAILIHFVYDFLIYATRYVDAVVERALGYA